MRGGDPGTTPTTDGISEDEASTGVRGHPVARRRRQRWRRWWPEIVARPAGRRQEASQCVREAPRDASGRGARRGS